MPSKLFFDNLSNEFQSLSNVLSAGVFASYLLGYDFAREECIQILGRTDFAEGDDDKKKSKKPSKKPVKVPKWRVKDYEPNENDDVATEITDGTNVFAGMRFDVPPQEAIDFFKRKKVLSAKDFYQLEGEAKQGAFAIANVYETDVTAALQNELIDALQTGRTQNQVIKNLKAILAGAGHKELSTHHLETVVRTSTQIAYGVGRRLAQEEVKDLLPIWEYSAVGDDRTRPTHMALDGLQYPANHPFWNKYYGPWDFRCRCTVIPTFNYRTGYDRTRPNDQTVLEYDAEGLPGAGNVAGIPINIKASNFTGVPRQTSLEETLKTAARRALDSRQN